MDWLCSMFSALFLAYVAVWLVAICVELALTILRALLAWLGDR